MLPLLVRVPPLALVRLLAALLLPGQLPQEPEPLVADCLVEPLPLVLLRLPQPLRHRPACLARSANTSRHSMRLLLACKCPAC